MELLKIGEKMKSLKLATKIGILAAVSIIVASAAVGFVASKITSSAVTSMTLENLETSEVGVMDTLDNWRTQLEYSTLVLADKTHLAAALANNDWETLTILPLSKKKSSILIIFFLRTKQAVLSAVTAN